MTLFRPARKSKTCFLLMALVVMHLMLPPVATAQVAPHRLIIHSCDSDGYPAVQCAASALDRNGLPLPDLAPAAFEVLDGAQPASNLTVTQTVDSAARTSLVLVVDASRSLRGAPLQHLREVLSASLALLSPQTEVALVGVTGPINLGNGGSAMPVDPNRESNFTTRVEDILARINKLDGQGSTPLFEATYKAVVLAEQKPMGSRAVLVFSDGRDTRSTTFSADHAIGRAVRNGLPVFTFGFGNKPDEALLRRLALETGGEYLPPSEPNTANTNDPVAGVVQAIQARLQTHYHLAFTGAAASDDAQHPITVRVRASESQIESSAEYRAALPRAPQIKAVQFQEGNQILDAMHLPAREIVAMPVLLARTVSQVEYELAGHTEVVKQAPFAWRLNGQALAVGTAYSLTLRAYGSLTDTAAVSQQTVSFALAAPIVAPPPRPITLAEWAYDHRIAILLGAICVLALLAGAVFWVRRRRNMGRAASLGAGHVGTLSMDYAELQPVIDAADRAEAGLNMGKGTMTAPAPRANSQTLVLQPSKAWLEISSGALKGQHFPLGMPGMESVLIGREVDARAGIRLNSPYVSREHARVLAKDDALFVVDLGSASGTKLNGRRLRMKEQEPIQVGDQLTFGDVQAVVAAAG